MSRFTDGKMTFGELGRIHDRLMVAQRLANEARRYDAGVAVAKLAAAVDDIADILTDLIGYKIEK